MEPQSSGAVTLLSTRGAERSRGGAPTALFASSMFVASALLFLVQPMFARLVLPRLGGSASVWNTCVLFFQAVLFAGYLYTHFSTKWFGVRRQAMFHIFMVGLPLFFLPLGIGASVPSADVNPVVWLLATMTSSVGAPFFVLSTTAPLLQRWFTVLPVSSARDPYFLYSASNLGSMLALLGYPFVIEPALGVISQTRTWSVGYGVFVAMIAACAFTMRKLTSNHGQTDNSFAPSKEQTSRVPATLRFRWIVLSFVPSSLMLAVTLHISTDIAAVPLLWVLPLTLYLLTFVVAFAQRNTRLLAWTHIVGPLLIIVTLLMILLSAHLWWFIAVHLATFFCCAMVCHKALAEARPSVDHLTEFYIWISAGGMLGGIFNTLIAPELFTTIFEYPLLLTISIFLVPSRHSLLAKSVTRLASLVVVICMVVLAVVNPSMLLFRTLVTVIAGVTTTVAVAGATSALRAPVVVLLAMIILWPPLAGGKSIFTGRSFFGVVRVIEAADQSHRVLRHGSTIHGRQQLPSEGRCEPTGYYHRRGPVGDVFRSLAPRPTDVAVVGLGAGGLACYAERGQRWTFVEIDPLIQAVATDRSLFSHLENSMGEIRVAIGDGRQILQQAPVAAYDMIIIDAFSSDAIPVHLLTDEAVALYMSRLKPDGVLVLHISNRYLRLERVVASICRRQGLYCLSKDDAVIPQTDIAVGRMAANWMAVVRERQHLSALSSLAGWLVPPVSSADPVWSDDYSNVFSVLKLD